MKDLMRVAALCLTGLAASIGVSARTPDGARYVVKGDFANLRASADSLGMWGPEGGKESGVSMLWEKWEAKTLDGQTRIAASLGNAYSDEVVKRISYGFALVQYDCKLARLVRLSMYANDSSGGFVFSDFPRNPKWIKVGKRGTASRSIFESACKAPFDAISGTSEKDYRGLKRDGTDTNPVLVIHSPRPRSSQPAYQRDTPRCVNPATGLAMNDQDGSCSGVDSSGSAHGQNNMQPFQNVTPGQWGSDPFVRSPFSRP